MCAASYGDVSIAIGTEAPPTLQTMETHSSSTVLGRASFGSQRTRNGNVLLVIAHLQRWQGWTGEIHQFSGSAFRSLSKSWIHSIFAFSSGIHCLDLLSISAYHCNLHICMPSPLHIYLVDARYCVLACCAFLSTYLHNCLLAWSLTFVDFITDLWIEDLRAIFLAHIFAVPTHLSLPSTHLPAYIPTCTCIPTCLHTDIPTYIPTYIFTYTPCLPAYLHSYLHLCARLATGCIFTQWICSCMHTSIHTPKPHRFIQFYTNPHE